MPFPFTLPTTSSFSFSSSFQCDTHPSLLLSASTYRGVLRDNLKKHKRLAPLEQSPHLATVLLSLNNYIPYLLAVDSGIDGRSIAGHDVDIITKSNTSIEWRPTLTDSHVPGRENARVKAHSLEYEIYFVLSTLAFTYALLARASLQPLYSSAASSPSPEQRTLAITTATKHLLNTASIYDYLATRSDQIISPSPSIDITTSTFRALASLALAEATLLAVLKDDPYPAAVAQDRNKNDKEWMIKAPEIPKVRAHLFGRLCLTASEHAANALSLLTTTPSNVPGRVDASLLKYVEDLKKTGRAKACRLFGIDAELGGQTGTGIAWLQAGLYELGVSTAEEGKKGINFSRFKMDWEEKREDKRVDKGSHWGSDAGKMEEVRVSEMLHKKWSKMNDTINTQKIPPVGPLMASIPSGRDMYTLKPWVPPVLESSILETMKALPDHSDDCEESSSGDENEKQAPAGAFPGTKGDYSGSGNYY